MRVSHGATVAPDTKRDARTHRSHAAPQSDSAHHSGTRQAERRADDGGTDGEEGRGRDHFEGTVPRHAHARSRSIARTPSLPPQLSLSQSISPFPLFMHFGFSRVLNDGAFANYRPTETLHGQSDTTTNLQAHVLIRLLLTMFSFVRVWIRFIPPVICRPGSRPTQRHVSPMCHFPRRSWVAVCMHAA